MGKYVSLISEIGLADMAEVGGKGANLGELTRAGYRVPPGFSVKAGAFDAFLKTNQLSDPITDIAAELDYQDLEQVAVKTASIRQLIEQAPMPADIAAEIIHFYERLQEEEDSLLVAVRSSVGTRDGSRSSFPGQMDTFHNVSGLEAVLELVRKCWASVWTDRAACTLQALGINHRNILIAPLVQKMVPSEVAGVLFTANPRNADASQFMLNACWGLGEAVVSGRLEPDEYVICKQTGTILSAQTGHKTFKIVYDESGREGNREVALDEGKARQSCLREEQIADLVTAGRGIEEHYGRPQDIEWAYAGGHLYILQARNITGLERIEAGQKKETGEWISEFDTPVKDPPEIFTSANISEVLPGVLSPLSQSGLKILDYGFWRANQRFGLVRDPFPEAEHEHMFLGCFYGRAHLNLSAFNRIVSQVPGGSATEFDRPFETGGDTADTTAAPDFTWKQVPRLIGIALRALYIRFQTPARLKYQIAFMHQRLEAFRRIDLSSKKLIELDDLLEENREVGRTVMVLHIINSMFAVVTYEVLRKLTRRWLRDKSGILASRLVTGLGTLESARPSFEIYRLYESVEASPALKQIFQEHPPETVQDRLYQETSPEVAAFLAELEEFLRRYGYRSVFEAEVMLPSWEQDPGFVFGLIQSYLAAGQVKSPEETEARQKQDRLAAEAEALGKLSFLKRLIFKRALKDARIFIPARENNKAILMMGTHLGKKILLEIKQRLAEAGVLEEPDDLYYLSHDEVRSLCCGRSPREGDRIRRRKEEYQRNQTVTLPEQFTGRPRPLPPSQGEMEAVHVLKGLPVSPGRVTGSARVIMNPREDARMESGEILVVPVTDASWTPLFLMAAALVVDIGGLLSHGAIVAREYGIPGVLNVISGTRRIKTGQMITVDGSRGEVYLHGDSPAETA